MTSPHFIVLQDQQVNAFLYYYKRVVVYNILFRKAHIFLVMPVLMIIALSQWS